MIASHLKTASVLAIGTLLVIGAASGEETSTEEPTKPKVLVVHDWSNSMWGAFADGTRKYEAGIRALSVALNDGFGGRDIGYRAYGHRRPGDCRDSELVVDFGTLDSVRPTIRDTLDVSRPTGKTPITYSLQQGLKDFQGSSGDILLISDGIETCDADPCELMREWNSSNINIRVHVVGVGLNDVERIAMTCIADESGGTYLDAESSDGFSEALGQVAETIETTTEPAPVEAMGTHAFTIEARDRNGRQYRIGGDVLLNGEKIDRARSVGFGRNLVDGPGAYEIFVGPLLRDGSIYRPALHPVIIEEPGETHIEIEVEAPARVTAKFTEDGAPHPGANVTAYQDGKEVFTFRADDEALAAPGDYEFRSAPNDDNQLSLRTTLIADTDTELDFVLNRTVDFMVIYRLPNGEERKRNGELWQNGERVYNTYSRFSPVRPGIYEHRSDDQNLPVAGVEVEISEDQQILDLPLQAGFVTIRYADRPYDYAKGKLPTRVRLVSLDRGGSDYATAGKIIAAAPGRYAIEGFEADGFFDRPEIDLAHEDRVEVTITPTPLGELVMTYAASDQYPSEPDRGFITALDDQRIIGGILSPGGVRKMLPGRYRIEGFDRIGDFVSQDVEVIAGQRTLVELRLRDD